MEMTPGLELVSRQAGQLLAQGSELSRCLFVRSMPSWLADWTVMLRQDGVGPYRTGLMSDS
jgi:hypothetical protein